LTVGPQSNSFLAPFLGAGASFINISVTDDPDGASGERVKALIRKFEPNVRIEFPASESSDSDQSDLLQQSALIWYGLRPDLNDCSTIVVRGLRPPLKIRLQGTLPPPAENRETSFLKVCRAVPDNTDLSALRAERRAADLVFDRLEDSCPGLFWPRRLRTIHAGNSWRRAYAGTDVVALIGHGRVMFTDQMRPHGLIDVGSQSDWVVAPLRLECGKRDGAYFAHVLAN
jgi:hypothetical protein